jgi:RNA polymerase sigma factor (sigma-70 family)
VDEARFRSFFEEHYDVVYRYISVRVPNVAARGDLAAEVFVTAWRRIDGLPTEVFVRPWLFGVARRVVSTYRRGEARRWRLLARLTAEAHAPSGPPGAPALVLEAFGRLRAADQEALRLVIWDELSVAEGAAALGCSVNAMNVRLHRARRRLEVELLAAGWTDTRNDSQKETCT